MSRNSSLEGHQQLPGTQASPAAPRSQRGSASGPWAASRSRPSSRSRPAAGVSGCRSAQKQMCEACGGLCRRSLGCRHMSGQAMPCHAKPCQAKPGQPCLVEDAVHKLGPQEGAVGRRKGIQRVACCPVLGESKGVPAGREAGRQVLDCEGKQRPDANRGLADQGTLMRRILFTASTATRRQRCHLQTRRRPAST